jgi:hypothetical protein
VEVRRHLASRLIIVALSAVQSEELMLSLEHLAEWLGYRFMSFDASVLVQDGKVMHVDYGLANKWVRPQYADYTGYIVSARSVHGFWIDRQIPFLVSSEDDENPRYRPTGNASYLYVTYTDDAPPKLTERAFGLDLSCFWDLRGCYDARKIAPALWQDIQSIRRDTYQQLISERCPDSIVEGRMRYLPDVTVFLLEVTGSRRIEVNEEGDRAEDWFTDYKLRQASGTEFWIVEERPFSADDSRSRRSHAHSGKSNLARDKDREPCAVFCESQVLFLPVHSCNTVGAGYCSESASAAEETRGSDPLGIAVRRVPGVPQPFAYFAKGWEVNCLIFKIQAQEGRGSRFPPLQRTQEWGTLSRSEFRKKGG